MSNSKSNHLNSRTYLVPEDQRHLYGSSSMHVSVYASSHATHSACLFDAATASSTSTSTSTFAPKKSTFALSNAGDDDYKVIQAYEDLHPQIEAAIDDLLASDDTWSSWVLDLLRLGFEPDNRIANPITLRLCVLGPRDNEPDQFQDIACKIVSAILEVIAPVSEMASIHVDVCRATTPSLADTSSSLSSAPYSLLDRNPMVYDSLARLAYASVGPCHANVCATVTGWIQHEGELYVVTCQHAVDPTNSLSKATAPYVAAEDTGDKWRVTCPAQSDHNSTMQALTSTLEEVQHLLGQSNVVAATQQILDKAKRYDIHLGYVYATSGSQRLLPQFKGRSDWAIIKVTNPDIVAENKHVQTSVHPTSGIFRSFQPPTVNNKKVSDEFLHRAQEYFRSGPAFEPVRDTRGFDLCSGQIVMKPRSRSTGWALGTFNASRSTQKIKGQQGAATREWCLVSLEPQGVMSQKGDSGSVILDEEFHPVAMVWGGELHQFAEGMRDVTYASPLSNVLRDIEQCLLWEEGSVSML